MAYGLKIWNASGVVTVDVSDRLGRFHGTYGFSIGYGGSGFVSVPSFSNDGTWFWTCPNAMIDGVQINPTTNGFNVSHVNAGPSPGGSYTIYVWRG